MLFWQRESVLIAQSGETKVMPQDVGSCVEMQEMQEMQETLALLRCLAMGDREVDAGQAQLIDQVVAGLSAELQNESERRS